MGFGKLNVVCASHQAPIGWNQLHQSVSTNERTLFNEATNPYPSNYQNPRNEQQRSFGIFSLHEARGYSGKGFNIFHQDHGGAAQLQLVVFCQTPT